MKESTEKDIDEAFEDILFTEENVIKQNYDSGFEQGVSQTNVEGFHLGYHRGAELGSELGYYSAVLKLFKSKLKTNNETSNKLVIAITNLEKMIEDFPTDNEESVDILQIANDIRVKFKKVRTMLKIDSRFPKTDELSF